MAGSRIDSLLLVLFLLKPFSSATDNSHVLHAQTQTQFVTEVLINLKAMSIIFRYIWDKGYKGGDTLWVSIVMYYYYRAWRPRKASRYLIETQ